MWSNSPQASLVKNHGTVLGIGKTQRARERERGREREREREREKKRERQGGLGAYLHPEEGDAREQIHCGLQVLQPLRTTCREVVLWT